MERLGTVQNHLTAEVLHLLCARVQKMGIKKLSTEVDLQKSLQLQNED